MSEDVRYAMAMGFDHGTTCFPSPAEKPSHKEHPSSSRNRTMGRWGLEDVAGALLLHGTDCPAVSEKNGPLVRHRSPCLP